MPVPQQKTTPKTPSLQRRTLRSTLIGGANFVFAFINQIALVPILLEFWGEEKYGLWIALLAFVTLLRTLDSGHQLFVGNEFNRQYFSEPKAAILTVGSSLRIALFLGLIELLIATGVIVFGWVEELVGIEDGPYAWEVKSGILVLSFMWFLVGSIGGLVVRFMLPFGKYAIFISLALVLQVLTFIVTLSVALLDLGLLTLCLTLSIVQTIYSVIVIYYVYRIIPQVLRHWRRGSWKIGWDNFLRSLVITYNNFLLQMNTNGIIVVVSSLLGALLVPVFTTIRTLANTVVQATELISNPLQPDIIRYHASGEGWKIRTIMEANWLVGSISVNLPILILIPFVESLYAIWTRGELTFYPTLFYGLALSVSLINYGKSMTIYLTGINHLRAISVITTVRAVIAIGFSFLLLPMMGLAGAGIAAFTAEICCSVLIPAWFTYKEFGRYPGVHFPFQRAVVALLPVAILAGYMILQFVVPYPYWMLAAAILLTSLVYQYQWKKLDEEVQQRLLSLIPSKIRSTFS